MFFGVRARTPLHAYPQERLRVIGCGTATSTAAGPGQRWARLGLGADMLQQSCLLRLTLARARPAAAIRLRNSCRAVAAAPDGGAWLVLDQDASISTIAVHAAAAPGADAPETGGALPSRQIA